MDASHLPPLRRDDEHVDRSDADREHPLMGVLHAGVPLSLLVDLSTLPTPSATEIFTREGHPDQRWWERRSG